jgi:ribosomal protein S18 acetylase RimI-like enzyme
LITKYNALFEGQWAWSSTPGSCYLAPMLVRAAAHEDLPDLVDFVVEEAFEAEGRQLDRDQVQQAVTAALENPHLAQYWVLQEPTGRVVGAIAAVTEWSDWRNAAYWWIQFVFLLPEVRGRGHLLVLVAELERIAQAQGAPELRLYVHPDNARAIRAYEKLGFAPSPYRVMTKALAPADGPAPDARSRQR